MLASSPTTSGMEGGSANPLFKGAGRTTMGNPKIFVNAGPAMNLLCPSAGNNFNNPVGATLVPSVTNVLFTKRIAEATASPLPDPCESAPVELAPGVFGSSIPLFSMRLVSRLAVALDRLAGAADETPILILDLRGCPGGEFAAFAQLADDFLPAGTPMCVETSGVQQSSIEAGPSSDPEYDDLRERVLRTRQTNPHLVSLVLIVDHATASAAELFAACMKYHGRAHIIGEATYGKAEAQQWITRDDGPSVYATVARYALPDGSPIHEVGVEPDLGVASESNVLGAAIDWASDNRR
jgi:carboxyl-terminal processing protease